MALQHTENLLRRYMGRAVVIKTMSGSVYEGRVAEVKNDYVELDEAKGDRPGRVFLLFQAIESVMVVDPDPR